MPDHVPDHTPDPRMKPLEPTHEGDGDPATPAVERDDVGLSIDPTDPLKRAGEDDMPGADPTLPVIPSD